jgi:hypothetical protein
MPKKEIKLCALCRKEINLSRDKHVLLGTYEGKTILDESYFHFQCFGNWFNTKVSEKAKNTVKMAHKKAMGLLGGIIGGGDQIIDIEAETKIN